MLDLVKDFGAVGDDVTDNTTAFTNAIAAAHSAGGVLYIPPGFYRHGALPPISPWRVSLRGEGPQHTFLRPTVGPGDYAVTLGWDKTAEAGWKRGPFDAITGLSIELPIGTGQGNILRVDAQNPAGHAHSMTFRDVGFVGGEVQIDLQDFCYLMSFDRAFFRGANLYSVRMDDPNTSGEHIRFESCVFGGSVGTAVAMNKTGATFMFTNCSFDYLTRALYQRAGSAMFVACHFETGAAQADPTSAEYLLVDRRGAVNRPLLSLTACSIYKVPATYEAFIRLRGDQGNQGVRITDAIIGVDPVQSPYLVRDDGPFKSNIVVANPWFGRGDLPLPKIRKQDGTEAALVAGQTTAVI